MTHEQPDHRVPAPPPPPGGGQGPSAQHVPPAAPAARPTVVTAVMWLFGGLAGLILLGLVVDAISLAQRYTASDLTDTTGLVLADVVDLVFQGVQVALALLALFLVRRGRDIARLVGVAAATIAAWTGISYFLRLVALGLFSPGVLDATFVAGGVLDLGKTVVGGVVLALLVGGTAASWFKRGRSQAPAGQPAPPPYARGPGGHPPPPAG